VKWLSLDYDNQVKTKVIARCAGCLFRSHAS